MRHVAQAGQSAALENGRFRLALSPSGALLSAYDKIAARELLGMAGAEFVLEEEVGCFCHIDPTGVVWRQSDNPLAKIEVVESGPLRWRAIIENESRRLHYRQEISIYEHLPWIEFRTIMDIRSGEDMRARAVFALPGVPAEVWAETPFGAVRRGAELAHAVNWTDCTGPGWGLGLLNQGLTGYEIAGDQLYLSLWRGLSLYNDCYGCLQREQRAPLIERGRREFRYALLPHAGDWRQAELVHWGQAFNTPLRALGVDAHAGRLPARHGWLSVTPGNVVVAAVKRAEETDYLVVRLYESHGTGTLACLDVPPGYHGWCETNLLEDGAPFAPLRRPGAAVAIPAFRSQKHHADKVSKLCRRPWTKRGSSATTNWMPSTARRWRSSLIPV